MPVGYSYTRFSGMGQSKGNTEKRQSQGWDAGRFVESPEAWCNKHGYTLDTALRFRDRGKSGYHGWNIQKGKVRGALGQFLDLIDDGTIQSGSVLIVEHLDRITRQDPDTGYLLVTGIMRAGVDIVTLLDGEHYSVQRLRKELGCALRLQLALFQNHESSDTKSYRSSTGWDNNRMKARKGERITSLVPKWVAPDTGLAIQDKAAIVERVFALAMQGHGSNAITTMLNNENVMPLGKGTKWRSSGVKFLLQNRRVLGEYQPRKVVDGHYKAEGDPIAGYYPDIIDVATFNAVQQMIRGRRSLKGRIGNTPNIFTGVVRSLLSNSRMHFVSQLNKKRKVPVPIHYLVSGNRRENLDTDIFIRYDSFEKAFLSAISDINPAKILATDDQAAIELQSAQYQLADVIDKLAGVRKKYNAERKSDILLDMIVELEAQRNEINDRAEQLKAQTATSQCRLFNDIKLLMTTPDARLKVASNIRLLIDRINVLTVATGRGQYRKISYYCYVEVVFHGKKSIHYVADQEGQIQPDWAPSLEIYDKEFASIDQIRCAYCSALIKYYAADEWKAGLEAWLKALPPVASFGGWGNIDSWVYSIRNPVQHVLDPDDENYRDFFPED